MYRSIWFWIAACMLALSAGCNPGDGGGDESTEDIGTDVVADVMPETDSPSDVAQEDVRGDGGDAEWGDGGEEGGKTDPGAAGDSCASECDSAQTVGGSRCEYCDGGWCFATPDDEEYYCTRRCDSQADCDELGDEWECDVHGLGYCSKG